MPKTQAKPTRSSSKANARRHPPIERKGGPKPAPANEHRRAKLRLRHRRAHLADHEKARANRGSDARRPQKRSRQARVKTRLHDVDDFGGIEHERLSVNRRTSRRRDRRGSNSRTNSGRVDMRIGRGQRGHLGPLRKRRRGHRHKSKRRNKQLLHRNNPPIRKPPRRTRYFRRFERSENNDMRSRNGNTVRPLTTAPTRYAKMTAGSWRSKDKLVIGTTQEKAEHRNDHEITRGRSRAGKDQHHAEHGIEAGTIVDQRRALTTHIATTTVRRRITMQRP